MPKAGNLEHRIAFYARVTAVADAYNSIAETYPMATVETRGEIRYTGGNRGLSMDEQFYSKSMELTVRYRSKIIETMRVKIDGGSDWYMITTTPEVLGRKEGLRMTLEKINM